jgi:hypothetical protein
MGTALQQTPFQCDQCGAASIVAASVVYEQGTHTHSGRFASRITQSVSAQAASPPRRQNYVRSFALWGPPTVFFSLWTLIGLGSVFEFHRLSVFKVELAVLFLVLCIGCLAGLFLSFRKVVRYNREVYPRLRWNWEHTYICRRCGKSQLIFS